MTIKHFRRSFNNKNIKGGSNMKNKILIILSLLLLVSFQAVAADKGIIELTSVSEVDIVFMNEQGEEMVMRVDAAKTQIEPGDTVIFTNYYTNNGNEPASDVVIKNPVPKNTFYIGGSASGEGMEITFSIDGGKTYDTPDNLIKTLDDGSQVVAKPSEYTDIHWVLKRDLQPEEKGEVSFQAEIE